MRTTLTIDDDLAGILRRKARQLDKSFKQLVNEALRKALTETPASVPGTKRVKTRPHSFGFKPGVDLDRLNQLVDDLEVEECSRQHQGDLHPE